MRLQLWDGTSDVAGVPAELLTQSYPLPEGGSLALVWTDDGRLAQVQASMPTGGRVAITAENLDELQRLLEHEESGLPATPEDYVTREEFDMLMTMVLEG